ncbi:unnamed protein product [Mucor fragilis]
MYNGNDTLFIPGYRESLGTIIGRHARSYTSTNNKSSYFKTLSMNNIIDVSNESKGSQMDLFHTDSAKNIQQLLDQTRPQIQSIDCIVPESYIQKFSQVEQTDRFLSKILEEIKDSSMDKAFKRIYTKI